MSLPSIRRAGAVSTASAGHDRAKSALYHSSTRRRSVLPSSTAARVSVPSDASASTRGQRRSGSAPPDASDRQQRNQRKTHALPASGAWHGRTGRAGAHVFDERGVLERGRRSGGVSSGGPQRDRGKTGPGNLRTAAARAGEREILFRGGVSTNSINSKRGGLNMHAIGSGRRANAAPAANTGGLFRVSVEREPVSLMRKRRERGGTDRVLRPRELAGVRDPLGGTRQESRRVLMRPGWRVASGRGGPNRTAVGRVCRKHTVPFRRWPIFLPRSPCCVCWRKSEACCRDTEVVQRREVWETPDECAKLSALTALPSRGRPRHDTRMMPLEANVFVWGPKASRAILASPAVTCEHRGRSRDSVLSLSCRPHPR